MILKLKRMEQEINKRSLAEQTAQVHRDENTNVMNKNKARKLLDKSE